MIRVCTRWNSDIDKAFQVEIKKLDLKYKKVSANTYATRKQRDIIPFRIMYVFPDTDNTLQILDIIQAIYLDKKVMKSFNKIKVDIEKVGINEFISNTADRMRYELENVKNRSLLYATYNIDPNLPLDQAVKKMAELSVAEHMERGLDILLLKNDDYVLYEMSKDENGKYAATIVDSGILESVIGGKEIFDES